VPNTVCKGDNSVIESSTKLDWLGGRKWSTTNYLANPHVFATVSGTEAPIEFFGEDYKPEKDPSKRRPSSPFGVGRYRINSWSPRSFDHVKDGQANTILLAEAMRYCSSLAYSNGIGFQSGGDQNRYVEMARLAFWSSPRLGTVVDMKINPAHNWLDRRPSYPVRLAIQPHPLSAGKEDFNQIQDGCVMTVPEKISWMPWPWCMSVSRMAMRSKTSMTWSRVTEDMVVAAVGWGQLPLPKRSGDNTPQGT
jgi:hypothetical protein